MSNKKAFKYDAYRPLMWWWWWWSGGGICSTPVGYPTNPPGYPTPQEGTLDL